MEKVIASKSGKIKDGNFASTHSTCGNVRLIDKKVNDKKN